MTERKGAQYRITHKHHGATGAEHQQRTEATEVNERFKVGGTYHAMSGITPEVEERMSNDEWLRYNMRKHGHGGI